MNERPSLQHGSKEKVERFFRMKIYRISRLLGGLDAEVRELVDLHTARNVADFWTITRRVALSVLPFDFCWFEPSTSTHRWCSAFANDRFFANEAEFRRFCDAHPVRSFLRSNPSKFTARLSNLVPKMDLPKSDFHREFMAPHQDGYAAVLAIGSKKCESFVGMHRRSERGDFSRGEMRLLDELRQHLGSALQRVRILERERQERQSLASLFAFLPLPTAVLDWELEVLYSNPAAGELAAIWTSGNDSSRCLKNSCGFALPPDIAEYCHDARALWRSPSRRLPNRRIPAAASFRHAGLPEMRVSVRLMVPDKAAHDYPVFVVEFEDLRQHVRLNNQLEHPACLPQLSRLTLREREVAMLTCQGMSDKEIATRLGKSVLTVKKQLGSIYLKLEVSGRNKLAALLRQ